MAAAAAAAATKQGGGGAGWRARVAAVVVAALVVAAAAAPRAAAQLVGNETEYNMYSPQVRRTMFFATNSMFFKVNCTYWGSDFNVTRNGTATHFVTSVSEGPTYNLVRGLTVLIYNLTSTGVLDTRLYAFRVDKSQFITMTQNGSWEKPIGAVQLSRVLSGNVTLTTDQWYMVFMQQTASLAGVTPSATMYLQDTWDYHRNYAIGLDRALLAAQGTCPHASIPTERELAAPAATIRVTLGAVPSANIPYISPAPRGLGFGFCVQASLVNQYSCAGALFPASPTTSKTPTPSRSPSLAGATASATASASPSSSASPTASQTASPSASVTPTATATSSSTASPTSSSSSSSTPSGTPTPPTTPTVSPTASVTPSITPTESTTATVTPTASATASATPSATPTPTASSSATATPPETPTASHSAGASPAGTPSGTPSHTSTATNTRTGTVTPTVTKTGTRSSTPSPSGTRTGTLTGTGSRTATPSGTPSRTETKSGTPTRTETKSGTPTRTETKSGTVTRTGTRSATATQSETSTNSGTPDVTPSQWPTPSVSRSQRPSVSSTRSQRPSVSSTITPMWTPTTTHSARPTPSRTRSHTASPSATRYFIDPATEVYIVVPPVFEPVSRKDVIMMLAALVCDLVDICGITRDEVDIVEISGYAGEAFDIFLTQAERADIDNTATPEYCLELAGSYSDDTTSTSSTSPARRLGGTSSIPAAVPRGIVFQLHSYTWRDDVLEALARAASSQYLPVHCDTVGCNPAAVTNPDVNFGWRFAQVLATITNTTMGTIRPYIASASIPLPLRPLPVPVIHWWMLLVVALAVAVPCCVAWAVCRCRRRRNAAAAAAQVAAKSVAGVVAPPPAQGAATKHGALPPVSVAVTAAGITTVQVGGSTIVVTAASAPGTYGDQRTARAAFPVYSPTATVPSTNLPGAVTH